MKTLRRAAASALIVALPCEAQALSCGARTCWRGWNQERNPNGPGIPFLAHFFPRAGCNQGMRPETSPSIAAPRWPFFW
jgi:hypothetical protein